jgi:hypothetical protein
MALVLSHIRGTWEHSSPKSLSVCDPKQLGATTSGSNILGFCGRLSYARLFARRPRNKRGTQKLTSPRSRLPIDSTPRKSASEKLRSKREEGAEYQRPSSGVYRRYLKICLTASDVKSSATPKNKCTDTQKTGCSASSPSSTRGSRSCSSTPSGPRALRPRPCQAM